MFHLLTNYFSQLFIFKNALNFSSHLELIEALTDIFIYKQTNKQTNKQLTAVFFLTNFFSGNAIVASLVQGRTVDEEEAVRRGGLEGEPFNNNNKKSLNLSLKLNFKMFKPFCVFCKY